MEQQNLIFLFFFGLGVLFSLVRIIKYHDWTDDCFHRTFRYFDYWLMAAALFLLVFINRGHELFVSDIAWISGLFCSFVAPCFVHGIIELAADLINSGNQSKKYVES